MIRGREERFLDIRENQKTDQVLVYGSSYNLTQAISRVLIDRHLTFCLLT